MNAHRNKKYQDRSNPANQFIHPASGKHNSGIPTIRTSATHTREEVKVEKGFDANQIDGPGDYGNIPGLKRTTVIIEVHSFNKLGYFFNRQSERRAEVKRRKGEESGSREPKAKRERVGRTENKRRAGFERKDGEAREVKGRI